MASTRLPEQGIIEKSLATFCSLLVVDERCRKHWLHRSGYASSLQRSTETVTLIDILVRGYSCFSLILWNMIDQAAVSGFCFICSSLFRLTPSSPKVWRQGKRNGRSSISCVSFRWVKPTRQTRSCCIGSLVNPLDRFLLHFLLRHLRLLFLLISLLTSPREILSPCHSVRASSQLPLVQPGLFA